MGTGIDLSKLRLLPNLKNLTLQLQPITDLQALEGLDKLERLDLRFCTKLTDLSALASLTSLEGLNLSQCRSVKDLTPLAALKNILDLAFNGVQADWSALEQVDFTRAGQDRGLAIQIDNSKGKLTFLAGVKRFDMLALAGIKPELWLEFVSGAQIDGIHNNALNQKQFEQLLNEHPEIKRISIPNSKVTDLTKLLSMPGIEQVTISQNMKKALKSIEGAEYSFRVEMW
jgi:Leucine-rich repeat (LRR) protein